MKKFFHFLGNVIWVLLGGLELSIMWLLFGMIWCITIVGIPLGVQCFKLARFALFPFGKTIVREEGVGKFIMNIFWFIFGGLELAIMYAVIGLFFFITIVGIPFGKQNFKLAGLALRPFGAKIVKAV